MRCVQGYPCIRYGEWAVIENKAIHKQSTARATKGQSKTVEAGYRRILSWGNKSIDELVNWS
ncbi:unnamed protein product [Fusarium graminearum]|uniref:Chromosome 4, complete genome n=1 Tax=Gibberella zeae (strain ATCC MYA-4620 / CBS 123657 / FGSC 9075 / NRRL 31084 / PH-1) TaxID=229533 RepID=A0A098DQ66_GIBZE|nr:unnamed protein product [Fusarium graminearum]CZS74005.1 unnamed protein product [Fusarium graminearum]